MTPVLIDTNYGAIRETLQPGDIVAFGGGGLISGVIKFFTFSPVSHIGVIRRTLQINDGEFIGGDMVEILESTTLHGTAGVQSNRMGDRVAAYPGQVWVLKLRPEIRDQLDLTKFYAGCRSEVGKKYGAISAILSGLHIPQFDTTHRRFCSQVAVAILKGAGIASLAHLVPADVSPIELCCANLYQDEYYQICGLKRPMKIRGFNTRAPWTGNL